MSGVSAPAVPDQPTSKATLVSSPSSVLMSSRCAPQPTRPENFAGASAPMSIVPLAMRFDDLTGLVAPVAVGVEPLIVVGHLIERPGRALARDARAVRRNCDRLERRDVAGAQRRVEIFLDPDRHAFRPHRQHERALDRPSARLADVDDQLGLQRARARAFGQFDRKVGMALVVGLNLVGELVLDCGEIIVGEAGDIAWKAGELRAFDDLQPNGAGDVEPARRRAIEKPRVEREFDRLAGSDDRLRRMEGEIEPLRNVILEHELDPADAVALGIGVSLDRPFARRRTWQQRYGVGAPAEALVGQGRASVFDAVRPLDDKRQRQAGFRHALGVAQKRGGEHGLARAIDAALGVEERVEPSGRIAAGDAAIAEVEGVLSEAEEAVVAGERGDQKSRRRAALARARGRDRNRPGRRRRSSSSPALRCCARRA